MLLEGQDCPSGDKDAKEEEEFVRQKLPPARQIAMCRCVTHSSSVTAPSRQLTCCTAAESNTSGQASQKRRHYARLQTASSTAVKVRRGKQR